MRDDKLWLRELRWLENTPPSRVIFSASVPSACDQSKFFQLRTLVFSFSFLFYFFFEALARVVSLITKEVALRSVQCCN